MQPVVRVGPLALQTSGLILLLSFVIALEVMQRAAARLALSADDTYNLGYLAAIAGLAGARLGYVAANWSIYRQNLTSIVALNADALSPLAGIVTALGVGYVVAQRKRLANRRLLDALAPGLVVFAAGLAVADLASGNGYGSPTTLPWAITLWDAPRHPVQIYHLMAALAIGLILARSARPFAGAHFGLFVAFYAASRFVLEPFHGDSALLGSFRSVQVASLLVLLLALVLLRVWAVRGAVESPGAAATNHG